MGLIKIGKRDVAWSTAATAFNLGSGFILLPVLMFYLSSDLLALWYIFLSLGSIVNLLDFGLNPSFARNVTNAWCGAREILKFGVTNDTMAETNYDLLRRVVKASRVVYAILAIVATLALITFGTAYLVMIADVSSHESFIVAWFMFCLAICLNIYYGYYAVFLRGIGEVGSYSRICILSKLVQLGGSLVLLYFGLGLAAVSIGYLASGLSLRFLSKKRFQARVGSANDKGGSVRVSLRETKDMLCIVWPNAWRDGLVSLSEYLATQASTIVCSVFMPLEFTGLYAITLQLANAVCSLSGVVAVSLRPQLQSAYLAGDRSQCAKIVAISIGSLVVVFLLGIVGIPLVIMPLLELVNPCYDFQVPLFLLMAAYLCVYSRIKQYAAFISLTNDIPYCASMAITSIAGVLLSIALMMFFDGSPYALVSAQLCSQICYNFWRWPRYAQKKFGITQKEILEEVGAFVSDKACPKHRCG